MWGALEYNPAIGERSLSFLIVQIKYLEEIVRSHEVTIADLEADNVHLIKVSVCLFTVCFTLT